MGGAEDDLAGFMQHPSKFLLFLRSFLQQRAVASLQRKEIDTEKRDRISKFYGMCE